MKSSVIFSITLVIISSIIVSQFLQSENEISTYIENSVPYVGTEIPRTEGLDGSGKSTQQQLLNNAVAYNLGALKKKKKLIKTLKYNFEFLTGN